MMMIDKLNHEFYGISFSSLEVITFFPRDACRTLMSILNDPIAIFQQSQLGVIYRSTLYIGIQCHHIPALRCSKPLTGLPSHSANSTMEISGCVAPVHSRQEQLSCKNIYNQSQNFNKLIETWCCPINGSTQTIGLRISYNCGA